MNRKHNSPPDISSNRRHNTPIVIRLAQPPLPGTTYLSQPVLRGQSKPFPTIVRPMDPPRFLDDFQTQKEVLLAVSGAIGSLKTNWDLFAKPFRFISPNSIRICISKHPGAVRHRITGVLIKPPTQSTYPMFKSCIELSTLVLDRPDIFPIDYLDDFEALYYSICWLCIAYISPGICRPDNTLPKPIWDWARYPLSKEVSQWKEYQILHGIGIESEQVSFYFGTPFETMLRGMREMLRTKYWRKVVLGRVTTERETKIDADRDFKEFNEIVNRAIREAEWFYWERREVGEKMWIGDGLDEVFFDPR